MDQCVHTLSWSIAGTYCTQCRQYFSIDEILRLAEGTLKLKSQLAEAEAVLEKLSHLTYDEGCVVESGLTAYRQKWQGEKTK